MGLWRSPVGSERRRGQGEGEKVEMLRAMILEAAIGLTGAASASAGNYKVMITTWHGCEEAGQGFQDYLKELGVGTDIILRDADQAKEALPGILAEARSENVDLSLSWGTSVTLGIGGTFSSTIRPTTTKSPRSEEHKSEL